MCVKLKWDLEQCTDSITFLDNGYLTFYQSGEQFFLMGIFSHLFGTEWNEDDKTNERTITCSEALESVALFTRMDNVNLRMFLDDKIRGNDCIETPSCATCNLCSVNPGCKAPGYQYMVCPKDWPCCDFQAYKP